MLVTLYAPNLNKHITIRLSESTLKTMKARMAIGLSLHMFPLETRRVKAKRSWNEESLKDYHLVYFNNQWHLKDKVSSNNTILNIGNVVTGKTKTPSIIIGDELE